VARRATAEAAPLLEELGMTGAGLEFEMAAEADPDGPVRLEGRKVAALPAGPASITLLARTNPGERLAPVNKGASGGELSRIALVLRSLALRGQAPALLLLDEVDAGIGADLAGAVARRLGALAEAGQLLVISHQAHIAAAADRHLVALKATDDERVSSEIRVLDRAGRVEEIVRMLGADTPESQQLASELLAADGAV
jgi:DNA repair protein RecN (Recombination protein N)